MIPSFDHNRVLPPHLGQPTLRNQISPYPTNSLEIAQRFATSLERIQILTGFFSFRLKLTELGLIDGFQWLDGSFLEDVESQANRPPNDLDVVTFLGATSPQTIARVLEEFPTFTDFEQTRRQFLLDHQVVELSYGGELIVTSTHYYSQLFSHTREGTWKGMLHLPLNTPLYDQQALHYLSQKSQP